MKEIIFHGSSKKIEMSAKYVLNVNDADAENRSIEVNTEEHLIKMIQTLFLQRIRKDAISIEVVINGVVQMLDFNEALIFANVEIIKRTLPDRQFLNSDLLIGQAIGIDWEPYNRDFFIYDIRQIHEARSGEIRYEYMLARQHLVNDELCKTSWIERNKLLVLENSVS
jgi:hypothetical protein